MDKATERRTDGGFCYISLIVVRGIWPTSFWKRKFQQDEEVKTDTELLLQ
jgi:hypothetical protein